LTEHRKPERVGLMLIHGIGDQPRGEHLKNVVESIASALRTEHGKDRVTVTVNSPFGSRGHVTIVAVPADDYPRTAGPLEDRRGVIIDIRESWWRDLAENPTLGAIAKFWWWAMTFCSARKRIPEDTPRSLAPTSATVVGGRVRLTTRLAMFAKTTAFFVILLPIHLGFQLLAVFPLFQRIHFLRTVFAYLNSVRLYQEPKNSSARIVENFFECRRLSILRRALNEAAFFASRKEFDRWYVFGHSLGSVVAHNLLNLSPQAIARLLPDWADSTNPGADFFKGDSVHPLLDLDDPNIPAHPSWYPDEYGIDADRFFANCAGLLTYGSPLETFAQFWPDIVMTRRDAVMHPDFQWLNLYDPIDMVASPITSLPPLGHAAVENVSVSTHPFFFLAHTSYLSRKRRREGHRIARAISRWLVGADKSLKVGLAGRRVAAPSRFKTLVLQSSLLVQAGLILLLGSIFLPRILAGLGNLFTRLATQLHQFLVRTLTDSLRDLDSTCGSSAYCKALHLLSNIGPGESILGDAILSLGVLATVFSLLLAIAMCARLIKRDA
jgi:pimeloyl-ACP methyl ester carboxylesterase